MRLERVLHTERRPHSETPVTAGESSPHSPQLEKACRQRRKPGTSKSKYVAKWIFKTETLQLLPRPVKENGYLENSVCSGGRGGGRRVAPRVHGLGGRRPRCGDALSSSRPGGS